MLMTKSFICFQTKKWMLTDGPPAQTSMRRTKMYKEWLPLNIEGVYNTLNQMSYFPSHPLIKAQR